MVTLTYGSENLTRKQLDRAAISGLVGMSSSIDEMQLWSQEGSDSTANKKAALAEQGRLLDWCPRPESNRHDREVEGFSYHFDFRRQRKSVVRGLEHAFTIALRP